MTVTTVLFCLFTTLSKVAWCKLCPMIKHLIYLDYIDD